jgi:LacI family transcriptional regulator
MADRRKAPRRPTTPGGDGERGPGAYVTAADVAREAGVSPATVSLVVNGKAGGRVSLETQRTIHEAVARLGYRVDVFARGLATGRRHTVALVTPDVADPFFSQVAMGVSRALQGRYQLILVATGDPTAVAPPRLDDLLAMRVDGMLIESTAAALLGSARPPCPVVILDAPGSDGDDPRVDFDIRSGSKQLAVHLRDFGHRSIGYLDWVADSPTFRARREAFVQAFERRGPLGATVHVRQSRIEIEDAAVVFRKVWLAWQAEGVTAVVCATDLQAYGVLRTAREDGIAVPGRLSVAGFNDLEFSQVADPPLTSVSLPALLLGERSAELLRKLIDGTAVTRRLLLATALRVRSSTAAANALRGSDDGRSSSGRRLVGH